jgi:ABC-2 type transport system ATP-binding protein
MDFAVDIISLSKQFAKDKGLSDSILRPFKKADNIIVLSDINLKIRKGELFGLLGPNGAGKTTLIKILSTLILPTNGTARINGYDILKQPGGVKISLGLISSEERSFYWRLTGRQNLRFFASLQGIYDKYAEKRINQTLRLVGLEKEAEKRFDSYSTGMKQKMAIARGLLNNPEILLMDEPTKGLDPLSAQKIREFIRDELIKKQKKTILLTTHNVVEAEQICDRIAIINHGKIRAFGNLKELKKLTQKSKLNDIFLKLAK